MKHCSKCKFDKPYEEFYKDKSTKLGLAFYCKPCASLLKKESKYKDLSAYKAYKRKDKLKRRYGITPQDHQNMLEKQQNTCGIMGCGAFLGNNKFTHVDHDHMTLKVRALLCQPCNNALGLIKDNFDVALGLAKYIQEHKGVI